jgi:hypothetical protein
MKGGERSGVRGNKKLKKCKIVKGFEGSRARRKREKEQDKAAAEEEEFLTATNLDVAIINPSRSSAYQDATAAATFRRCLCAAAIMPAACLP